MIENHELKIKKRNFAIMRLKKELENLQTIENKVQVDSGKIWER
jgi:hypothetical protein